MKGCVWLFALFLLFVPGFSAAQTCGPMDVVFVIDDTGSMGGAINNIKSELNAIIASIATASGNDYRLGLVTFKDNVTVRNDLAAGNTAAVQANMNALSAVGGGLVPEASDEALNTVINGLDAAGRPQTGDFGVFRPAALKIIVLVTDAPPAGFDDSFSAADQANAHQRAVEAAAKGIRITAIHVPTFVSATVTAVMSDYASTTGGLFVTTQTNGAGTAAGIQEMISSCGVSCMTLEQPGVLCATDPLKGFLFTFKVKNLTGGAVQHMFLVDLPAGVTAIPSSFNFSGEPGGTLAKGATSKAITVRLRGPKPGDKVKLRFSLHDAELAHCCSYEKEIQLPSCECAQIVKGNVTCNVFGSAPSFTYNFTLENLAPSPPPVELVLVAAKPPLSLNVSQSTKLFSPIGFGGDIGRQVTFSGPGAVLGGKVCLRISTHDRSLNECCAIDQCLDLPSRCFDISGDRFDPFPLGGSVVVFSELGFLVDGIGASGNDGARFDFGEVESFRVGWQPVEPAVADGASLRFGATGTVDGTPDRPLGELKITDVGAALEITADYSAVGSTKQRLEIYREGELVQTITGHSGPVARVPRFPTSCGKSLAVVDGQRTACYWPGWDDVIPIEILGGPTVMGDGLRVLAENPAGELDFLQTFSLRAASIPSIMVSRLESSPAAGPADLSLSLNTGFNQATGRPLPFGRLPVGVHDHDWQVVDNHGAKTSAKLVINRVAAWPAPLPGSRWISANPDQGRSTPGVRRLRLENCFCIGEGATEANLSLQLLADDAATVLLNGATIGGPGGGFGGTPLKIDLAGAVGAAGPFRAGQNCLRVEVDDRGGVVTGLDLVGTVQAPRGACGGAAE